MENILERVKDLYYRGNYEEGVKLLEEIPDRDKNHEVHLFLGMGYKFLNRFLEAEVHFKKSHDSSDPKIQAYSLWGLGGVEIGKGNFEAGIKLLKEIEGEMRKTPQYPSYLFDLATGLFYINRLDEAIDYLKKALTAAEEKGDLHLIVTALSNLAVAYDVKGDIRNALSLYKESVRVASRLEFKPVFCNNLLNLAELYAEMKDSENALKVVDEIKKGRCIEHRTMRVSILAGLAKIFLLLGKVKQASEYLEMSEKLLVETDKVYDVVTYHVISLFLSYKSGILSKVKEHTEEILKKWNHRDTYEYKIAYFMKAYVDEGSSDIKNIEEVLGDEFCNDLIVILPVYAKFLLKHNLKERTVDLFNKIYTCIEEKHGRIGYFTLFKKDLLYVMNETKGEIEHPEFFIKIAASLGDNEFIQGLIQDISIGEILKNLIKSPTFHPQLFLTIKTKVKTPEEKENYRILVSEYRARNSINVYTFGNFEVFIGPYKITSTDWKRPSVRDLFKFFVVNKNKLLPRDYIMESMWPGEDPEKAHGRFRVYISLLRDVIEPWLTKEDKPSIVKYVDGKYGLNLEEVTLDTDIFEKLVMEANRSTDRKEATVKLERAVELYRADFLEDDIYSDFVFIERERLRNLYFQAVEKLVDLYRERDEKGKMKVLLDKAFFIDPTNDSIVRNYVSLLLDLGERANALKVFKIYERTLKNKYEIEPSPEIAKLVEGLKGN